jgi:hypothetical protein
VGWTVVFSSGRELPMFLMPRRHRDPTEERRMDYLRRLQLERPVLFWVVTLVAFLVGFQLLLFVAGLLLGPFGVPSWAAVILVVGVLVVIARRQQR